MMVLSIFIDQKIVKFLSHSQMVIEFHMSLDLIIGFQMLMIVKQITLTEMMDLSFMPQKMELKKKMLFGKQELRYNLDIMMLEFLLKDLILLFSEVKVTPVLLLRSNSKDILFMNLMNVLLKLNTLIKEVEHFMIQEQLLHLIKPRHCQ